MDFSKKMLGIIFFIFAQHIIFAMDIQLAEDLEESKKPKTAAQASRSQETHFLMIDVLDFAKQVGIEPMAKYAVISNNVPLLQAVAQQRDVRTIKIENYEINLLHLAARQNCPLSVVELIKMGVSIDSASRSRSETPLFLAVSSTSLEAVQMLLQHGADPNLVAIPSHCYSQSPLAKALSILFSKRAIPFPPSPKKNRERERSVIMALLDSNRIPRAQLEEKKAWIVEKLRRKKAKNKPMPLKYSEVCSLLNEKLLDLTTLFEELAQENANSYLRRLPAEIRQLVRTFFRLATPVTIPDAQPVNALVVVSSTMPITTVLYYAASDTFVTSVVSPAITTVNEQTTQTEMAAQNEGTAPQTTEVATSTNQTGAHQNADNADPSIQDSSQDDTNIPLRCTLS